MTLAGIALCLLPVLFRNHAVGGEFALSTSGAGTNFYGGNNAENPYGRATEFSFVRGIPEHEAGDWRSEAERRAGRELSPTEVSRYWMGEVWRSVAKDPGLHLSILWNKLRLSLGRYEVPDNHGYDWDRRYVPVLGLLPGFGLLGLAGIAGLLLWVVSARFGGGADLVSKGQLTVFFVLYLGTIVLTVTSMRARLPLVVLLAPAAGAFAVEAALRLRQGRVLLPACALAGAGLAVLPAVFDSEQLAQELAKRDFNLAVHLGEREDGAAAALEIIRELDQRYPGSSRVIVFRAELEAREALPGVYSGDPARRLAARETVTAALRSLREVAEHSATTPRERFRANAVGGLLQLELGNPSAALNLLRAALAFDPDAADLLEAVERAEAELASGT